MWVFLHTLVESVKEEDFKKMNQELFNFIKSICSFLPCPECSKHAKIYLKQIKQIQINTKDDFRKMLFNFHNEVNKRNKSPIYKIENMSIYKTTSLIHSFNNFYKIFSKTHNLQQINQSFQRKLILQKFSMWLKSNQTHLIIK
jgi:hypothetical protein